MSYKQFLNFDTLNYGLKADEFLDDLDDHFHFDEDGNCHGFSMKYVVDFLYNNEQEYFIGIESLAIRQVTPKNIIDILKKKECYETLNANEMTTYKIALLISGIHIFQNNGILDSTFNNYQSKSEEVSDRVTPDGRKLVKLHSNFIISKSSSKIEHAVQYFQELREILRDHPNIAITLSSIDHTMALRYDAITNHWIIVNNGVPHEKSADPKLIRSFVLTIHEMFDDSAFNISIFTKAQNERKILQEKLDQLRKKTIDAIDRDIAHMKTEMGTMLIEHAVDWSDSEFVSKLIDFEAPTNTTQNKNYISLIMLSIANKNRRIFDLLLNAGANVNQRNSEGINALMFACYEGSIYFTKRVLDKVNNINTVDTKRRSALIHAVLSGNHETVQLLCEKKVNVNKPDCFKKTALLYAAYEGNPDIVRILIENNADVHATGLCDANAIHFAALSGKVDVLELLFKANCDINHVDENGDTPLCIAAREGNDDVVRKLIDLGAQFHAEKNSRLFVATYEKYV